MSTIFEWFNTHQQLLTWLGFTSLITFVASLFILPWLVGQIPHDYFVPKKRHPAHWKEDKPLLRLTVLIGKNFFGYLLLLGGILMLVFPGQGILTIAMGLLLIDYPGKFQLERKIASQKTVLHGLNWLRKKRNKEPFILE